MSKCPPGSEPPPQAFRCHGILISVGRKCPHSFFSPQNEAEAAIWWECMYVCVACQHQWFKRICSTGPTAEYCELPIRTSFSLQCAKQGQLRAHTHTHKHLHTHAPMMHISTFGCAALMLVQLHSMSLSPLPPSGWTVISTLLSGNAKLWIMDEVQVASDHSRALTWQTQWQTWQGQQASVFFSASSPPCLCPFATFFISMFIRTNQQDDTSLFISK